MAGKTRIVNISLLILCSTFVGMAVWILRQPSTLILTGDAEISEREENTDTVSAEIVADSMAVVSVVPTAPETQPDLKTLPATSYKDIPSTTLSKADLKSMIGDHPFAKEAAKVISGRLEESDSMSRRSILNYCEHLRTAYTTKDIDFIRQVFSDDALIIVGHTVKSGKTSDLIAGASDNVRYSVRTKDAYISRLAEVFAANKKIDIRFSDFRIMRHPSIEGIYGVTLRQKYTSNMYGDEGYLFLLWDFRNASMPQIHVRTWQLSDNITDADDLIGLGDFNLQ